jgi:methionyl aminopeptidase
MSIGSESERRGMERAGRIVARTLVALRPLVKAGVTTAAIDLECARRLERQGARSAPRLFYGFPGSICISVNDEAVHGVPGERAILPGDLVKLDLTVEKDGFVADAAITIPVPPAAARLRSLAACAESAFGKALRLIRAGLPIRDIGGAIEAETLRHGFAVIPELTGHGVGRAIHEEPVIPNYPDERNRGILTDGLVIAVEPILTSGSGRVVEDADGWTVRTEDGAPAVHFEHTILVTRDRPVLLTAA